MNKALGALIALVFGGYMVWATYGDGEGAGLGFDGVRALQDQIIGGIFGTAD